MKGGTRKKQFKGRRRSSPVPHSPAHPSPPPSLPPPPTTPQPTFSGVEVLARRLSSADSDSSVVSLASSTSARGKKRGRPSAKRLTGFGRKRPAPSSDSDTSSVASSTAGSSRGRGGKKSKAAKFHGSRKTPSASSTSSRRFEESPIPVPQPGTSRIRTPPPPPNFEDTEVDCPDPWFEDEMPPPPPPTIEDEILPQQPHSYESSAGTRTLRPRRKVVPLPVDSSSQDTQIPIRVDSDSSWEPTQNYQALRLLQFRDNQPPRQAADNRQQHAAGERQRRADMTPSDLQALRVLHAEQQRLLYLNLAVQAAEIMHADHIMFMEPNREIPQNAAPRFNESAAQKHTVGRMDVICPHCRAKHFRAEQLRDNLFTDCCQRGKLRIERDPREFPDLIKSAVSNVNDPLYRKTRDNIRQINCAFQMVSFGANFVKPPGNGPFVFRINGSVYHKMSPPDAPNNPNKSRNQLYFMTPDEATSARMAHPANQKLDKNFMIELDGLFREVNPHVHTLLMAKEFLAVADQNGVDTSNLQLVYNRDYQIPGIHAGRQNMPVSDEIAAIFPLDDEGIPPFERDFAVYVRDENDPDHFIRAKHIDILSPHLDSLTYPLIFPYGEPNWKVDYQCEPYVQPPLTRRITMNMFYKALLQERDGSWNSCLHFGRLTQQLVTDIYCKIEANRARFHYNNQESIQGCAYHALKQYLERRAAELGHALAKMVILPSTFAGSDRHLRQECADAMAIFNCLGKPDLFITLTCNPKWKDILDALAPGETAYDRPDIVARVFKLKLNALIDMIKSGVFGPVVAFVYNTEFQKRGLPHAHILVTLQEGYKPDTPDKIDDIVCAELPDKNLHPELFETIRKSMIHGPCRAGLCLDAQGQCTKKFPKPYTDKTQMIPNQYPLYRRREEVEQQDDKGAYISNRYVIPYSPHLSHVFDAHINVEVTTGFQAAIRYIYKYIFKGFDTCTVNFTENGDIIYDEIRAFMNCRYVSPPEAMHRIFNFNLHKKSHTVQRLAVHEEHRTEIEFDEGMQVIPENEADTEKSTLTAFFELNSDPDSGAQAIKYVDIPKHFVYKVAMRKWVKRQQRGNKIIGRIRCVNNIGSERFAIRLLLLNITGPTSFEHLRTINGVVYPTFREACVALNLIGDMNHVFRSALNDMASISKPCRFRYLFATLIAEFNLRPALELWEQYRDDMIYDFRLKPQWQNVTDEILYNLALFHINLQFERRGRTNHSFGLPMPDGVDPIESDLEEDVIIPTQNASARITLNTQQQEAFDAIMNTARSVRFGNNPDLKRCFILIGPGGSGKTTLYREIVNACLEDGMVAKSLATTGIASTLMPDGATVHRGFGIPVPTTERSSSNMITRLGLPSCQALKRANIILIDEMTMMNKHIIRVIDEFLRVLMNLDKPFGGKVIVLGGDFRQLLPVVPGGNREKIIIESIIHSPLWNSETFTVLHLTENMRAQGDAEHCKWLLDLGKGILPEIPELHNRAMVEIPPEMVLQVPPHILTLPLSDGMTVELLALIHKVFGDGNAIASLSSEDLASRAILSLTVKSMMSINNFIIRSANGQERCYYANNRIMSDNEMDRFNFDEHWMQQQQPSGMPPHELILKVGIVVMLIRNIAPDRGLSNGTRMIVRAMYNHIIVCEIISEKNKGAIVDIFRTEMMNEERNLPVVLVRVQFPLIPSYALTINKSQGQTFKYVGIHLYDVPYNHGQLYVAMSRSRERQNICVYVQERNNRQGRLLKHIPGHEHRVFTQNVVYHEVFARGELQPTFTDYDDIDDDTLLMLAAQVEMEIDDDIIRQCELLESRHRANPPAAPRYFPNPDEAEYMGNYDEMVFSVARNPLPEDSDEWSVYEHLHRLELGTIDNEIDNALFRAKMCCFIVNNTDLDPLSRPQFLRRDNYNLEIDTYALSLFDYLRCGPLPDDEYKELSPFDFEIVAHMLRRMHDSLLTESQMAEMAAIIPDPAPVVDMDREQQT